MARRRMIDPDIWHDEKLAQLDFAGRLFFIGMITQANDYGKLRGNPKILKSLIFPYEENHIKIELYISKLHEMGIITTYEINGEMFIKIKNWNKYQTLTYKGKDIIPEPILNQPLTNTEPILNQPLCASKEKRSKVKYSVPKSGTQEVFKYFCIQHEEMLKRKYIANFGKDNKIIKDLLKVIPETDLKTLIDKFFSSKDEFIQKAGYTVGVFQSQVNKLRTEPAHKESEAL